MRRLSLLIVCGLLLGFVLAGSAVAEDQSIELWAGPFGADGVDVSVNDQVIDIYQAVIPYDSDPVHHDSATVNLSITNAEALYKTQSGDPNWHYEVLEGLEDVNFRIEGRNNTQAFLRTDDTRPQSACEGKVRITCEWDGLKQSVIAHLIYEEVALPTGCDIPEFIDVQVGKTSTFTYRFDDNYSYRGAYWYPMGLIVNGGQLDYLQIEELFSLEEENGSLKITPRSAKPGYYPVNLALVDANVSMNRDVIIRVKDQDGNVPAKISNVLDVNVFSDVKPLGVPFYQGDYGDVDLHVEETLCHVNVKDALYDQLAEWFGGTPEWRFEKSADDVECEMYPNGRGEGLADEMVLALIKLPDKAKTVTFTVFCDWGDYHDSYSFDVNFRNLNMPESLQIDDEIHLKAGERTEVPYDVNPSGWTLSNGRWFDISAIGDDMEAWCDYDENEDKLYITANRPGIYKAIIFLREGNIVSLPKRFVRIYVEDEGGDVPSALQSMAGPYEQNFIVKVSNTKGLNYELMDSENLYIIPDNWNLLTDLYGGDFKWDFETVSGPEADMYAEMVDEGFNIHVSNFAEMKPGQSSTVKATLRAGEDTMTTEIKVNYLSAKLPSIKWQTDFFMRVDETFEAAVKLSKSKWYDRYFLFYDIPAYEDRFIKWGEDQPTKRFYILPHESGYFIAYPHIHADNLFIWGDEVVFRVTDADGNYGEVLPIKDVGEGGVLGVDHFRATSVESGDEGLVSENDVLFLGPDNVSALVAAYGEKPKIKWSYEYVDGIKADLVLFTGEWYGVKNASVHVALKDGKLPSKSGTMYLDVICNWAGHKGRIPCSINFMDVPENAPTENTFEDVYLLKLGERLTIEGYLADGEFDAGGSYIDVDQKFIDVDYYDDDNPNTLTLIAKKAGKVKGRAFVNVANYGAAVVKDVIFVVVDPDKLDYLMLPESLTSIEKEAFMGIKADVVVVPDSCEAIASRAFADCPNLVEVVMSVKTEVADDAFDGCDGVTFTEEDIFG